MTRKEELQQEIKALNQKLLDYELDQDDYTEDYDNMLDKSYGDFMGAYPASMVLKQVDEIAYRCGLNDFLDGISLKDTDGYKEIEAELNNRLFKLSVIENEEAKKWVENIENQINP